MKILSDADHNALREQAENASRLENELKAASDLLVSTSNELAQAKAALDSEKARADKAESDLAASVESHAKALADKEAEVESRAAQRAAEIVASQGVPPIAIVPSGPSGGLTEQLEAITDPVKRAQFIKRNSAQLLREASLSNN